MAVGWLKGGNLWLNCFDNKEESSIFVLRSYEKSVIYWK